MSARRIDQGMAAAAARHLPAQVSPELRTRYRQLRAMLHSAGLAATYAFVAAKTRSEGGPLGRAYQQVALGMRERLEHLGLLGGKAAKDVEHRQVLELLGGMPAPDYARASAEAAALATWLSRLADASYQADRATDTGAAGEPAEETGAAS